MTPSAIAALFAILACQISGAVSKTSADYGVKNSAILKLVKQQAVGSSSIMKNRTNINVNNSFNKSNVLIYDDIYSTKDDRKSDNLFKYNIRNKRQYNIDVRDRNMTLRRSKRDDDDPDCSGFIYTQGIRQISHPKSNDGTTYRSGVNCETIIDASSSSGNIISLDFVDVFHIEDHPQCEYDYLEIRDGKYGYSNLLHRYCGETFPPNVKSSGPYLWLKFHSDDTIEYEGFHINVKFEPSSRVKLIPESCYIDEVVKASGVIDTDKLPQDCLSQSKEYGSLDVLWTIETDVGKKIYLNFTEFKLEKPNECKENYVEVFGAKPDIPSRFEIFCGSMANSVITKDSGGVGGNLMYVHLFTSNRAYKTQFKATYTVFRTLDPNVGECEEDEFDCEDNTCIDITLKCDRYAHCRLKADEDYELCKTETESLLSKPHILVILVIFSLILSGMSFVFLFKCIRKLVQDHKIIKEHIRQSCEDRLDRLDVRKLSRGSLPRASLERENHTNEMFKKQRSHSHHKSPSSIDSDYIQETQIDLDDEIWRRDAEAVPIETDEIRIENGRNRKSDISRKEDSIRRRRDKRESIDDVREKKEIKDASVGAPDTKESGCQTRESLFQTGPASSDGTDSGSNGRAFSTFGYSGATLVRPSPPAPVTASQITIELLKDCPSQETKTKKIPDRRPMSNETTRSAPDVIIVSKPIR